MRCIDVALRLFRRTCHKKDPRKPIGTGMKWDTRSSVFPDDNLLCKNVNTIKEGTEAMLNSSQEVNLEVNENEVYIHVSVTNYEIKL
jgi:hypothetical protein